MMRRILLGILLAATLHSGAWAISREDGLSQSRAQAEDGRYDEALHTLQAIDNAKADDVELRLMRARILSWKGDHAAAEAELATLDSRHDDNADVMLLRANLAYIAGDYAKAEQLYTRILAIAPDYADAADGLERVQNAQAYAAQGDYLWQLDAGLEHSDFDDARPNWNQQFVQITRFLDDKRTALHGKVARYEQFRNIDSEYELGVSHRFSDRANGYVYGVYGPQADFRPEYRIAAGGAYRLTPSSAAMPLWMTVDSRMDWYADSRVLNINPGAKVEFIRGWSLAGRVIVVDQEDERRVYGFDARLNGTLTDRLRGFIGYADAPETIDAVTVDTQTYFGGLAFDVTPRSSLLLSYAHDDRENTFERQVINAGIRYRF